MNTRALVLFLKHARDHKIDSDFIAERKRELRRRQRMEGRECTYYENEDGTTCKKFYTVEYSEGKDALWETACIITSPYDCTGEVFTKYFVVGHIRDNLYRVCEVLGIDI